jgi:hypothetical protein
MPFRTIAVIRADGFREELSVSAEKPHKFKLLRVFISMGQSIEEELTTAGAKQLLARWGELNMLLDDFEVMSTEEQALDSLMEGQEWHPLS